MFLYFLTALATASSHCNDKNVSAEELTGGKNGNSANVAQLSNNDEATRRDTANATSASRALLSNTALFARRRRRGLVGQVVRQMKVNSRDH